MKMIQNTKLDDFTYARIQSMSEQLGRTSTFGILKPDGDLRIEGSLYFIHGGDGDDEQFLLAGLLDALSSDVRNLLKTRRIQIVLPSIGLSFLREDRENPKESYSDYFLKEVLPGAEAGTDTHSSTRFLMGISMGGHASLNLMFRRPEMFAGVGVLGAGIVDFSPYNLEASKAYQKATGIADGYYKVLMDCFFGAFKTEPEYFRHDPLQLLQTLPVDSLNGKSICLDVGVQDEFGLCRGTEVLSQALRDRGVPHSFEAVPGQGHNMEYVKGSLSRVMQYVLEV